MGKFYADRTLPTVTVSNPANRSSATYCAGVFFDEDGTSCNVVARVTKDLVFGERADVAEVELSKAAALLQSYAIEELDQLFFED